MTYEPQEPPSRPHKPGASAFTVVWIVLLVIVVIGMFSGMSPELSRALGQLMRALSFFT